MPEIHSYKSSSLPPVLNKSRVVLMARDPHCLYAYWEISPDMYKCYTDKFGDVFFNESKQAIKVNNISKNDSYFLFISEDTASRYIEVEDSNCIYSIEIGRYFDERIFIGLSTSNYVNLPAGMEIKSRKVYFADYKALRDDKTGVFNDLTSENSIYVKNVDIDKFPCLRSGANEEGFTGISSNAPSSYRKG